MKTFILSIFLFLSLIANATELKTFVPKGDNFESIEIKSKDKSVFAICNELGYHIDQYYVYTDFDVKNCKVYLLVLKIFSNEVICLLAKDTVNSIERKDVNQYLKNYNFEDNFSPHYINGILKDGVQNKSLSQKYLSDIFKNSLTDQKKKSFIAPKIGFKLFFKEGFLVKFKALKKVDK